MSFWLASESQHRCEALSDALLLFSTSTGPRHERPTLTRAGEHNQRSDMEKALTEEIWGSSLLLSL